MSHGETQPNAPLGKVPHDGPAPGAYRHLLREPAEDERVVWPGTDAEGETRLARLGAALADAQFWTAPLPPQDGEPAPKADDENPSLPAGYTYLYQLAAHDLLQTTLDFPILGEGDPASLRNLRTLHFDLDTLYGRGPAADPHAYAIETALDGARGARFRMGLGGAGGLWGEDEASGVRPRHRDIGRAADWNQSAGPRLGPTEAMLADPRNDDNGVLSQVTTLFMHVHGLLFDAAMTAVADRLPDGGPRPMAERRASAFSAARVLTERLWRRLIARDLAPRLLDPAVAPLLASRALTPLDPKGAMPLEFSHAVLRSGHMLARKSYRFRQGARPKSIEEVLRQSSRGYAMRLPATTDWVAQWSCFFDVNPMTPPQLARRFGPSQPRRLDKPYHRFPNDPGDPQHSLSRIDQIRGARAELWKPEALIGALGAAVPALAQIEGLKPGADAAAARRAMVSNWIGRYTPHPFSAHDAATLAEDPPLKLYVEIEAAALRGGRSYGPLGSVVVAAVFQAALPPESAQSEALPGKLAAAAAAAGAPEAAETIQAAEAVADMPGLLRFLAPRAPHVRGLPFL
ncbi:MAG: hypothetical protein AAGI51_06365 [Pseudomonadota bacterium]